MIITRRDLIRLIRSEINGSLKENLAGGMIGNIWAMARVTSPDDETADLYSQSVSCINGSTVCNLQDPDGDGVYSWHKKTNDVDTGDEPDDPDGEEATPDTDEPDDPDTAEPEAQGQSEWVECTEAEQAELNRLHPRHVKSVAIATAIRMLNAAKKEHIEDNSEAIPDNVLDDIADIIRPHGENAIVTAIEGEKEKTADSQMDVLFSRRGTVYDLQRIRDSLG